MTRYNFTIRDLTTYDEFLQVRQVQQAVWGFGDPNTGLYPPVLSTASKNGGVVLGALDPEGQMVGYIFGFLGREPGGPLKLCSQTMGVLREWRSRGVATALKWAQRDRTLAAGLPLITWTFDPLESPNARLNMHKLGVVSRHYWRNVYGERFGALNEGLPTDRLLVEWWIRGQRVVEIETRDRDRDREGDRAEVKAELEAGECVPVFEVEGWGLSRRVMTFHADLDVPCLSLEVPADIQHLKRTDMPLARDWRLRVREAFERYLGQGYIVTDFVTKGRGEARRSSYVLSQITDDLRDWVGME
jgi:predicted GNAT superfamily acetyltransferase